MIVEQLEPKPLSDEEQSIFAEIEASGAGYYKPRKIIRTYWEGTPFSWEGIFESEEHYSQYLEMNRLQRPDDDLMEYFSMALETA
jgi:hypothetical protein